jgi:hypothetical protein
MQIVEKLFNRAVALIWKTIENTTGDDSSNVAGNIKIINTYNFEVFYTHITLQPSISNPSNTPQVHSVILPILPKKSS